MKSVAAWFLAAVASALSPVCASGQCPSSVRALLDDYPPLTWGEPDDGLSSTNYSPSGQAGDSVLLTGAGRALGLTFPYGFATLTWDGRHTLPLNERSPPTYPHTWYSTAVDPATNRPWVASYGGVQSYTAPTWSTGSLTPPMSVRRQLASVHGSLYLIGQGNGTVATAVSVYRLDGAAWTPLPPITGALNGAFGGCEYDGSLLVSVASGLKRWNGAAWSDFGPQPAGFTATAMTVYQDELWIAGTDTAHAARVLRLVGGAWQIVAPPDSVTSSWPKINDLTVFRGELNITGHFGPAGPNPLGLGVLKWTGSGWESPGTGVAGAPNAVGLWDGLPVASGVVKDGRLRGCLILGAAGWELAGLGTTTVNHFATHNGRRVAAGSMRIASGAPADYVAVWDQGAWRQLGQTLPGAPSALCAWNGGLAAVVREPSAKRMRVLVLPGDSEVWQEIGVLHHDKGNSNSIALCITEHAGSLVVAGDFHTVTTSGGTVRANNAAVYRAGSWSAITGRDSIYTTGLLSRPDGLHALVRRKRGGGSEEMSVVRWTGGTGWEDVAPAPALTTSVLFTLNGRLGASTTVPSGYPTTAYPAPTELVDGVWRPLGLPRGLLYSIDDRTVVVASSEARSAVQVYRFTFSADFAGGPDDAGDGVIDGADFTRFSDWMFAGDRRADLGSAGGAPVGDDRLDGNDWQVFFDMFFGGCR